MDTTPLARTPLAAPLFEQRAPTAVQTDLSPPQAVTPPEAVIVANESGARRRGEIQRSFPAVEGETASDAEALSRGYVADESSDALVFQVTDPTTGSVVYQIPTEQTLKLRAYAEQAERGRARAAGDTDLEA
jgi:hypothetical protein